MVWPPDRCWKPIRLVTSSARLAGYDEDPAVFQQRTFEEAVGYDEMVVLRNIGFVSHCEHHMAPIPGRAHVGHLPRDRLWQSQRSLGS